MAKRGPKEPSIYTQDFIEAQAEALIVFAEKVIALDKFPTLALFAASQNIDRQRFSEWAREGSEYYNEKFSDALKKFKGLQEDILTQNALNGSYNASFAIFTAKNVLGWRDEQHIKADGMSQVFQLIIPAGSKQNRLGVA